MPSLRTTLCLSAILAAPSVSGAQVGALPADSLAVARRLSGWMLAGSVDSIAPYFRDPGNPMVVRLGAMSGDLRTRAGHEVRLIEERWVWRNGRRQYWRVMEMSAPVPEPIVLRWDFDHDGRLRGFGLNLLSQVPAVEAGPPSGR